MVSIHQSLSHTYKHTHTYTLCPTLLLWLPLSQHLCFLAAHLVHYPIGQLLVSSWFLLSHQSSSQRGPVGCPILNPQYFLVWYLSPNGSLFLCLSVQIPEWQTHSNALLAPLSLTGRGAIYFIDRDFQPKGRCGPVGWMKYLWCC